jgi:FkbM family methyltransferase
MVGLAAQLANKGHKVHGFFDVKAKPNQQVKGVPVAKLEDWLVSHDPSRYAVTISLFNGVYVDEVPALVERLTRLGFHLFENFGKTIGEYNWCDTEKLDCLDALLADEKSRQCLEEIVRYRFSKGLLSYPRPSPQDVYHPHDLPPWPNPLRFIDGGAFDGDTLRDFLQNGHKFDAIVAFEPDPENFQKLVRNTENYENIVRLPCAMGRKTETLYFSGSGDMASHITLSASPAGGRGSVIQCISLDEALPTFAPNLIKMDIEGAEPDALMGAKNMISKHRPGLAICLYHEPEHLFSIPLMLNDWNLGYRFYIRTHHLFTADTVLYAFPGKGD